MHSSYQLPVKKIANGADFGIVSEDEKIAILVWRKYRDACMKEACEYKSMSEVVKEVLNRIQEVFSSPAMNQAAKIYLDLIKSVFKLVVEYGWKNKRT